MEYMEYNAGSTPLYSTTWITVDGALWMMHCGWFTCDSPKSRMHLSVRYALVSSLLVPCIITHPHQTVDTVPLNLPFHLQNPPFLSLSGGNQQTSSPSPSPSSTLPEHQHPTTRARNARWWRGVVRRAGRPYGAVRCSAVTVHTTLFGPRLCWMVVVVVVATLRYHPYHWRERCTEYLISGGRVCGRVRYEYFCSNLQLSVSLDG